MIIKKKTLITYNELGYTYTSLIIKKRKLKNYKFTFLSIFLNKKLMYLKYIFKKKYYTPSTGQILGTRLKNIKYFKKSNKSFGIVINLLNKRFKKYIKSIFMFFCNNYTYKNYLWIKKFQYLINPEIGFFIVSKSWNYITKKRRRIKRKIFRNLLKKTV